MKSFWFANLNFLGKNKILTYQKTKSLFSIIPYWKSWEIVAKYPVLYFMLFRENKLRAESMFNYYVIEKTISLNPHFIKVIKNHLSQGAIKFIVLNNYPFEFDFSILDKKSIIFLLLQKPDFYEKYKPYIDNKLTNSNWVSILSKQPLWIYKIPQEKIKKMTSLQVRSILKTQPLLYDKLPLENLNAEHRKRLLFSQPQLENLLPQQCV